MLLPRCERESACSIARMGVDPGESSTHRPEMKMDRYDAVQSLGASLTEVTKRENP